MGYSSTVKASYTYDAIQSLEEFDSLSTNIKYFSEIGKENSDGSITGTVYELLGEVFTDEQGLKRRKCKKRGSFKIDSQGKVVRFPGVSKRLFGVVQIASMERYDREYSMFRII